MRPAWKGSLKLSLIAIPIRVYPATTTAADVHFRQLHRRCHTPIQLRRWCPHCKEAVAAEDVVRGYESAKGRYVLVEDEEIARLRPEATHVVELSHLVDAARVGPLEVERTYFVTPDSKAGGSALAVMREALDGRAAIGRVALHGREYLVALEAYEQALVMYTLRTAGDVRDLASADGAAFLVRAAVPPAEVKLARRVLAALPAARDLSAFTDRYEESLRAMVAQKSPGDVVTIAPSRPGKVVNLMDALKASLATAGRPRPRPARARAPRPHPRPASAARTRRAG